MNWMLGQITHVNTMNVGAQGGKCHIPYATLSFSLPQAVTQDGTPANQTGEKLHKIDKDYGLVCLNKDQPDGICHNYKVRFLCGKLGTYTTDSIIIIISSIALYQYYTLLVLLHSVLVSII